jgi:MFS transporter, PAT family, beta-lactamase induction signal transducer AmpG
MSILWIILCGIIGFISAIPPMLLTAPLQAWLMQQSHSILAIGCVSLLQWPTLLKWLWAPWMDRYQHILWTHYRGWIILMLTGCGCITCLLAIHPHWLLLSMLLSLFSATLDIAVGAHRNQLAYHHTAILISAVIGYKMGGLGLSSISLWLASYMGFPKLYWLMGTILLFSNLIILGLPSVTVRDLSVQPMRWQHTVRSIVCYKFVDTWLHAMWVPLLLHHHPLLTVGWLQTIATIFGITWGAWYMHCTRRPFLWQLLCQITALMLMINHPNTIVTSAMASMLIESASCISTLLVLKIILKHGTNQAMPFAIGASIVAWMRVSMGPIAGWCIAHYGWSNFMILPLILCMLILLHEHRCL